VALVLQYAYKRLHLAKVSNVHILWSVGFVRQ
jgi:hypothetical protein